MNQEPVKTNMIRQYDQTYKERRKNLLQDLFRVILDLLIMC